MAEKTKSLLDQPARGAFAESAARFENLIRSVKSQHAEAGSEPKLAAVAPNPLLAVSPDEEWSRQFQSSAIGPQLTGIRLSELAPVPRAMIMADIEPLRAVIPDRIAEQPGIAPRATIGAGLAKPERPRRSWLGRMLLGN